MRSISLSALVLLGIALAAGVSTNSAQVLPQVSLIRGTLGTAPPGGATGTLTTGVTRAGAPTSAATCSSVTPPSPFNQPGFNTINYNVHYLKNPAPFPICVPVHFISTAAADTTFLHLVAFQAPFSPADITNASRFRGDAGVDVFPPGTIREPSFFHVLVPGNSSVALVVYNSSGAFSINSKYDIRFNVKRTFYGGAPVAIPDNNPTGASVALGVSAGRISDLRFLFPATNCSSVVGDTNAAIDHSFLSDLVVKLRSPANETVTLIDRIGIPNTTNGNGGNNICNTIFGGGGSNVELFTGQPLEGNFFSSDFGASTLQNANGNWILNVADLSLADTGSIRRFGIETTSVPRARTPFDYDGDNRTDISIFRPGAGEWWVNKSSDGGSFAVQFGQSTDAIVPADYTGDGVSDIGFWRPSTGEWFILRSDDFSFYAFPFGTSGDIPVPGDYDGDSFADAAVFRPSNVTWYYMNSYFGGSGQIQFGNAGDRPVPADYDGDGKTDVAIFRPSNGQWWRNGTGVIAFGTATDKLVQGDYTGDGKADVAIWRPSTGQWYIVRSEDNSYYAVPFGTSGDIPVPGDYDGDGRSDTAVFRPTDSTWFVQRSAAGTLIQAFGAAGDRPTPNAFVQ